MKVSEEEEKDEDEKEEEEEEGQGNPGRETVPIATPLGYRLGSPCWRGHSWRRISSFPLLGSDRYMPA